MTTISPVSDNETQVKTWVYACEMQDLVANSGVCALVENKQIALFMLTDGNNNIQLYACDNYDPFGKANVLSRGILCSMSGEICICSPLYKHHFSLVDGRCLEEVSQSVNVYQIRVEENEVFLLLSVSHAS